MSRSRDDKGRLAYIECDFCDAKIRPGAEYLSSEWRKGGWVTSPGGGSTCQDACPEHTDRLPKEGVER